MRILGGDYLPGAAAGERGNYLASVLCACFLNPGDPIRVNVAFFCRSSVNCGYHGAYLRRPLGERHHYRDGGRLGNPVVGEEASPTLVPRSPQDNGKRN